MATKIKNIKRGDIVRVEWLDACSQDEWKSSDDISLDPELVLTVGIVFEYSKTKVTVALNQDMANDSFSCLITIPSGMILSLEKLASKR